MGRRDTVTIVNAAVGTTRQEVYGYDAQGRLDRMESPEGVICYGYNALGQKTSMWTEKSATDATVFSAATYGYDELGRLKNITQTKLNGQAVSLSTTYRYDAVGNLAATTLPTGTLTSDLYDDVNRLDLETITQGAQTLASYDYHLLADGNRDYVIETDSLGGHTRVDWTYDVDGRLTRETRDEGNDGVQNGGDYTDTYTLDLVGNRLSKAHDAVGTANDETTTDTYNERDQLVSEDSTNNAHDASYTYDNNGSQINDGTHKFVYDLQDRLVQMTDESGNVIANYGYDDAGNRFSETTGGITTFYVIDANSLTGYPKPIEEWVSNTGNRSNATLSMTYVLGDRVLAQADGGGSVSYFLTDGHGSTRAMLTNSGVVTTTFDYDAYGNALGFDAATAPTVWLFGGDGMYDRTSGLYLHGSGRPSDPSTGLFIQADPPGYGNNADPLTLHRYLYTPANPVNYHDPTGHFFMMFASMLGYSGTILHNLLDPGRQFEGRWGLGRELTRSMEFNTSDPFALADLHQASQELQLMDIVAEARRGLAATSTAAQLTWDAIFETFDLNEQILMDLMISPFFASACFAAGTPIVVGVNPDGTYTTKPIEEVRDGDSVLARDERDPQAQSRLRRVEAVFSRDADRLQILKVRGEQGEVTTIRTTEGHLIWASGRGWIKAVDLLPGDRLSDPTGSETSMVVSNEREECIQPQKVYTFRVEADHTYFVADSVSTGAMAVWVHNVCSGPAQYEEMMRNDVGVPNQSQAERTFMSKSGNARIADALPIQNGAQVPYDAKWVRNGWANSPFNPESALGKQAWARANQVKLANQAKDYVDTFGRAVYQSNSQEALDHFRDLFGRNRVDVSKIKFELVIR